MQSKEVHRSWSADEAGVRMGHPEVESRVEPFRASLQLSGSGVIIKGWGKRWLSSHCELMVCIAGHAFGA